MAVSLQEYKEYYLKNKRFMDGQYSNSESFPLKDKQIQTKFNKYQKRTEKKLTKTNTDYADSVFAAEKEARDADCVANVFWNSLTEEQSDFMMKEIKKCKDFSIIDSAHIIPRSKSKELACDPYNIIMLPRIFHSCIDSMVNPFSERHETISKEEQEKIWIQVVGKERWDELHRMLREGNND